MGAAATAKRPPNEQWVHFLRSHDECDLGRLLPEQRAEVFAALAPDKSMQLYDRGIRRRLAPMLGNDRRRLALAFSLLFSLPDTPMIHVLEGAQRRRPRINHRGGLDLCATWSMSTRRAGGAP